ncbi:hypothetical protein [Luteibacter sp. UNCMF366Tsu5.1]|uniref:hypothetical protein n=1 Tax=Luteibacter sp. UNCMF366Tsu5.1 TaxID=1502758 RepID=UPI0015A6D07C|nr:hypothetical protein [Luteibacter sp. UNCMF366Tsu5.1]
MKSFCLVADASVRAAIHRYGFTWPIATDNGLQTWGAYGNRFRPALYLIDRIGRGKA